LNNNRSSLITVIITFFLCAICLTRPLISGITFPNWNFIYQIVIVVMLMAWLIMSWEKGRLTLVRTGVDLPLILLSVFVLLSVSRSVDLYRSLKFVLQFISYVILFYIVVNNIRDRKKIYLLSACFITAAVLVSLYGFYQYFWGLELTREFIARHPEMAPASSNFTTRLMSNWIFSTFVYQNALAGYLIISIPLALSFLIIIRKAYLKSALLLSVVFMMTALFMTYSKAGWAICILLLFLYAGLFILIKDRQWRHKNRKIIGCVFLLILLGVIVLAVINPSGRLGGSGISGSFRTRWEYWEASWAMIRERPFLGFGPDCFGSVYSKFKPVLAEETQMAHNNYLQMWTDSGVFAFICFIWLWFAFCKKGFTGLFISGEKEEKTVEDNIILLGLVTGVTGFLLHSLLDFSLYVPGITTQVFIMMGMGIFISHNRNNNKKSAARDGTKCITKKITTEMKIPLIIFTAGVALFACFYLARLLRAEIFSGIANGYIKTNEPDKAGNFLKQALKNNKLKSELYYLMAKLEEGKLETKIKTHEPLALKHINTTLYYYREAIRRNSYMPYYHYQLSLFLWKYRVLPGKEKEFEQGALYEIKQAVDLYPTKPFYWRQLSELYKILGQFQKAKEQINQAEYLESQM